MKPENRPKIEFEGRKYDDYQATQKQRQIERTVRKLKRRKVAFEAAGLKEDAQATNIRLRRLSKEYSEFSKAAGLPEQRERMKVSYVDDASTKRAAEILEKRTKSGILNDNGYKGIPITDEAVRRVPSVRPEGWTEEQAAKLQEAHRELLRAVMDKPVGTEAGAIYSPDMRLIAREIGRDHQILIPQYSERHVFIHNHPSGLTFSMSDLENFGKRFDLELMTAVGNDGTAYFLQKIEKYSPVSFSRALLMEQIKLKKLQTPQEYADEINRFLEEAEQYGIRFISRR